MIQRRSAAAIATHPAVGCPGLRQAITSDMTSAITVSMSEKLALRVSLQWLYNNKPALQEIDVIFIDESGAEIDFGTTTIRKEKLDTIISTSLVIKM